MDASSSNHSTSFILEERICDLENKLSHSTQALKTKEHVARLQQEQIKKLEDMYKQCLQELAQVTCEHKKTTHDLENLRIILKSYERRQNGQDFESQVDLIPPPCSENHDKNPTQFEKINVVLEHQTHKIDDIISLLRSVSSDQLDAIRLHIEELEANTNNLLLTQNTHKSLLFPIVEEPELNCLARYKIFSLNTSTNSDCSMCLLTETASQTNLLTVDSSTNYPEDVLCSVILQTEAQNVHHVATLTNTNLTSNCTTQCELQRCHNAMVQNTIFDLNENIHQVQHDLINLEQQINANESIYDKLKETIANCNCLVEFINQKDDDIYGLKQEVEMFRTLIERSSVLTIEQIKTLCNDLTIEAGHKFKEITQNNDDLKAENEMLHKEIENFKVNQCEYHRVTEVMNQCNQTQDEDNENHRQRVIDLSKELTNAYASIKRLNKKNEALKRDAVALEDLKALFAASTSETSDLFRKQLHNLEVKYDETIKNLKNNVPEQTNKNKNIDLTTTSTQIYGWAPMTESVEVLRLENEQLTQNIINLKRELDAAHVNQATMRELQIMCLTLGQDLDQKMYKLKQCVNDNETFETKENSKLSERMNKLQELQEEIASLRAENKQLSDGVKQLRIVVKLDSQVDNLDYYDYEQQLDSEHTFSEVTSLKSSQNRDSVDSKDLKQLRYLCNSLSANLTQAEGSNVEDRLELLASLENDLRNLMQEFMDFKCFSQNEHQVLMLKHSEVLAQNEELIHCLGQYKSVNDSLLQSHYEMEKAKSVAQKEHQNLLDEYLTIRAQSNLKKLWANKEINTNGILRVDASTFVGNDDVINDGNVNEIKELRNENCRLRQEVDKLHLFIEVNNNNHEECLQSEILGLNNEIKRITCNNVQLTAHNEQLKLDLEVVTKNAGKELDSLNIKYEQTLTELNQIQLKYKDKDHEVGKLQKALSKATSLADDYTKLEEEVSALRADLNQKNLINHCNDALRLELQQMEEHLQQMTDAKVKLEMDFESYIRTNNMLQHTMNAQNLGLADDLKAVREQCEKMKMELDDLNASKAELLAECATYKSQLVKMAQCIEGHMKDHLEYKADVDEVKGNLQKEIANLKRMLDIQKYTNTKSNGMEVKEFKEFDDNVDDINAFISAKDLEIDYLMGQKLRAMEVLGQMQMSKKEDEVQNAAFKVQLNLKKAVGRNQSLGRPVPTCSNVGHPRSASVPRMSKSLRKATPDKDTKKLTNHAFVNTDLSGRFALNKKISNLPMKNNQKK